MATEKVIEKGDFVTLDYGAYYKGILLRYYSYYCCRGTIDKLKEIYNIVLKSQLRGGTVLKPGMTGKEADAINA